jgi:hypothetical protein
VKPSRSRWSRYSRKFSRMITEVSIDPLGERLVNGGFDAQVPDAVSRSASSVMIEASLS